MRLPKVTFKIPSVSFRKFILIIGILFILLSLGLGGGYVGYRYLSAKQALAECDRKFSEKEFLGSASACEKSANFWFRQNVKDKAEKAKRIYSSHNYYLDGLKFYSNKEWQKAVALLSKVITEDPDYSDAIEKIAQAKKDLDAQKVASAQTQAQTTAPKPKPSPAPKPSVPPSVPQDVTSQQKIAELEQKVAQLQNPPLPSAPPQPDAFTLSLTSSEIKAVVMLWCFNPDTGELLPYIGSGTIYNPSGYIYTNKHVVAKPDGTVSSAVTFCAVFMTNNPSQPPTPSYWAILYAYSTSTDVADLTIGWDANVDPIAAGTTFPYLPKGSSDSLQIGQDVWVAGYPASSGDGTFTLTKGIVSGEGSGFYRTDAQVDSGNSGGAVLNPSKQFIGIPTAVSAGNFGSQGLFLGIDDIDRLVDWITFF